MQNTVVLCSILYIDTYTPETSLWYVTLYMVGKSLAHISFVHTIAEKRDTEPVVESFVIN